MRTNGYLLRNTRLFLIIQTCDLTKYTSELLTKWKDLVQRLELVIDATQKKLHTILSKGLSDRLAAIRDGLAKVKVTGEKMIPESIKELQQKLRLVQQEVYEGEWHAIPKTLKSNTREIEARLVETPAGKQWTVNIMDYPPTKVDMYSPVKGWPDLKKGIFVKHKEVDGIPIKDYTTITSFSGKINHITLKPGTKLYRVVTAESTADGICWTTNYRKTVLHGVKNVPYLKTGVKMDIM